MITIKIKDDEVSAVLAKAVASLTDMTDLMQDIGEDWFASTQDRVAQGETPDGTAFAPRSQTTLDRYAKKGLGYGMPLNQSGAMRLGIFTQSSPNSVEIASSAIQAAMMQFGGTKAKFPNLWGDIPARPFLGISDQDRSNITEAVTEWLQDITDK